MTRAQVDVGAAAALLPVSKCPFQSIVKSMSIESEKVDVVMYHNCVAGYKAASISASDHKSTRAAGMALVRPRDPLIDLRLNLMPNCLGKLRSNNLQDVFHIYLEVVSWKPTYLQLCDHHASKLEREV